MALHWILLFNSDCNIVMHSLLIPFCFAIYHFCLFSFCVYSINLPSIYNQFPINLPSISYQFTINLLSIYCQFTVNLPSIQVSPVIDILYVTFFKGKLSLYRQCSVSILPTHMSHILVHFSHITPIWMCSIYV